MEITFKQYLVEDAKTRSTTKRVADAINRATDGKFKAQVSNKTGSSESALAITLPDSNIPEQITTIFKQRNIGIGDKETTKNKDRSVTVKFVVVEL